MSILLIKLIPTNTKVIISRYKIPFNSRFMDFIEKNCKKYDDCSVFRELVKFLNIIHTV